MSAAEKRVTGITGLTGSGKSEACAFLREAGYRVIDADKTAHGLYKKNSPLYRALVKKYGKKIEGPGGIDRKALAQEALRDDKSYREFTALVYPPLVRALTREAGALRESRVIVDMAVLYESGFYRKCGAVIVVSASEKNRKNRCKDKWNTETMKKIRRFQRCFTLRKKIELGAGIIYNNESKASLRKKIIDAVKRIERESVWKRTRRKKILKKLKK